jgi:myosin heavy subunit
MVMDQLVFSGVLETVRIQQQGYPVRKDYASF